MEGEKAFKESAEASPVFQVSGQAVLCLLAGSNSQIQSGKSEVHCGTCKSETGSESESALKSNKGLEAFHFAMQFVPKHLQREVIITKLEQFGALKAFTLEPMADVVFRDSGLPKSSNFQIACFSFESKNVNRIFEQIKRVRIKGLQVKVSKYEQPQTQKLDQLRSDSEIESGDFKHHVKPTSMKYFRWRFDTETHLGADNYSWRLRITA